MMLYRIVDGPSLFVRLACAEGKRTLNKHEPVLSGTVIRQFFNECLARDFSTDENKLIVAWDGGRSTRRKRIYPEYKSNRTNEHRQVIDDAVQIIKKDGMNYRFISLEGTEADDVIYWLSWYASSNGHSVEVVTTDSDFYQVMSGRVSIWNHRTKREIKPLHLLKSHFLHPDQYAMAKSLVGDSSDNIGGVAGIGKKAVRSIFQLYNAEGNSGDFDCDEFKSWLGMVKRVGGVMKRDGFMGVSGKKIGNILDSWDSIVMRNFSLISFTEATFTDKQVDTMTAVMQ